MAFAGAGAVAQKDYASAWGYLEQALDVSRQRRAVDREGWTYWDMAEVAFIQGDAPRALKYLSRCMSLFEENGEPRSLVQCLRRFAKFFAAWGQPARAVTVLAAAARAIEEYSFPILPEEQITADEVERTANAALSNLDRRAARQQRGAMPVSQAVRYALGAYPQETWERDRVSSDTFDKRP